MSLGSYQHPHGGGTVLFKGMVAKQYSKPSGGMRLVRLMQTENGEFWEVTLVGSDSGDTVQGELDVQRIGRDRRFSTHILPHKRNCTDRKPSVP